MCPMRSSFTKRAIATVTALIVMLASVVGAHGHAAAHNLEMSDPAQMQSSHLGLDHWERPQARGEQATWYEHFGGQHAESWDTICHGGYAVAVNSLVILSASGSRTYLFRLLRMHLGSAPNCLDRPPKTLVFA